MNDEQEIERRNRRYWFEDGFAEIATGALFAAVGLLFLASVNQALRPVAVALLVVVIGGGVLTLRVAIRATKERVTYPRTGYVEYRRPATSQRIARVAVAAIALGAATTIASGGSPARFAAVQGITLAVLFLAPAVRFGIGRFYAISASAVAFGVVASLLRAGEAGGGAILYGGVGAALIGSGALALRAYLRRSTALAEGDR